ncbi:MAG: hypothetical protein M3076_02990 [Actinomycetota bacterium]|nr:hypothetical protein [Actinomycetota bacterium]
MSEGIALLTYLWHYLVARLLYDDLLRPLLGGDRGAILGLIVAAVVLTLVLRAGARRTK